MAANEIKNIAHAGITASFVDDSTPPVILAAWGVDDEEGFTSQSAIEAGNWTIPLSEPVGAHTDPVIADALDEISAIVLAAASDQVASKLQVSLVNLEFYLTPSAPLDEDIQLDVILFRITDDSGDGVDAGLLANVEVLRMPQRE